MPWLTRDWSRIYGLADRTEMPWFGPCDYEPGVYRLVALREGSAGEPMSLARLRGRDGTGTLCIGVAPQGLRPRLERLVERYQALNEVDPRLTEALRITLPADRIGVCWSHTGDGSNALVVERALLDAYVAAFDERPPLNRLG